MSARPAAGPVGRAFAATLCLLASLLAPPAFAVDTAVDAEGTVHRIEVVASPSSGTMTGTALRYTYDPVDGDPLVEYVPGTQDAEPEKHPDLALDPVTGAVLVTWSRLDETGSSVLLRRREAGTWSDAVPIDGPVAGELQRPRLSARRNLIHVVWSRDLADAPERLRLSLDRRDLRVTFGPEWLPTATDSIVPPSGGEGTDDGATRGLSYFASTIPPDATTPGGGGNLVVWGIRDEPIPITFREVFEMPTEVRSTRLAEAAWVHDRLAVWVRSGQLVYYVLREDDDRWTEFRSIPLAEGEGTGDAVRLIEAMLRRDAEGSAPD
jgi:hypothetical protein